MENINKERVKVVVPQELLEELSTIEGFEIKTTKQEISAIQSYDFNLSSMINLDTMSTAVNATVAIVGFLSSVNGSILLLEKIKKYINKSEKKQQQIKIITSNKQFIIDKDTTPEIFHELESLFSSRIN